MPGHHGPERLAAPLRRAAVAWHMKKPRVECRQVRFLLEACDFSCTSVVWQPWTMEQALHETLQEAGVYVLGHIVGTRDVVAPRDMLLQPMLYAGMRDYHGVLDVCILTGPEELLDVPIPLALCFLERAVFAWVPLSYISQPSPARDAFLRDAARRGVGAVVHGPDLERKNVWLGIFTSKLEKDRMMFGQKGAPA